MFRVFGLVFGCVDLYFGCLDLHFGCLDYLGSADGRADGQTGEQTDGRGDRRMDGRADGRTDGRKAAGWADLYSRYDIYIYTNISIYLASISSSSKPPRAAKHVIGCAPR